MYKYKEIMINKIAHDQLKNLSKILNIKICHLVDLLVTSYCGENNGAK